MISTLTHSSLGKKLWLPELAFLIIGRSDTTLALQVMARNGSWLNTAAPALLDSAEVILKALPSFPQAYEMASPRLRDDLDFLIEAISIDSTVARHASPRLQAIILDYANKPEFLNARGSEAPAITIENAPQAESALRIHRHRVYKLALDKNTQILKALLQTRECEIEVRLANCGIEAMKRFTYQIENMHSLRHLPKISITLAAGDYEINEKGQNKIIAKLTECLKFMDEENKEVLEGVLSHCQEVQSMKQEAGRLDREIPKAPTLALITGGKI